MTPPHLPTIPHIIAHRGASRECLENTLAAFERALEQGADGIELDVHGTSDGVVVVHHDAVVRDSRTGTADTLTTIADTSHADLSVLRLLNFEPVPTLDAVLDRVGQRATVYVEVKGLGIEEAVVACLERHPDCRTAVHGFDHRIPEAIRKLRPASRIGILSASYLVDMGPMLASSRPDDLWQVSSLIDQPLVDLAHQHGARVVAWTENDAIRARALIGLGVDAICTDTPGRMKAALGIG